MALRVNHVNGDTTFLLTFYPSESDASTGARAAGSFCVLVDPWLEGESAIFHRRFAVAKHTTSAPVKHLSELPTPNVVVISQDRTDHCHAPTLKQLDPALADTLIFAHPAACRRIKSWKHFDPSRVIAFPTFSDKKPESIVRFRIPAQHPSLEPGEATLAFIPSRFDITGTHNAVGITYRAPCTSSTLPSPVTPPPVTVTLPDCPSPTSLRFSPSRTNLGALPPTPPESPKLRSMRSFSPQPVASSMAPLAKPRFRKLRAIGGSVENFSTPATRNFNFTTSPLAAPLPATPTTSSTASTLHGFGGSYEYGSRPRTLSVLYSPHGVSYAAVRQYASAHLVRSAGLPLTLLLHAFDRVTNAWYLGGNIIAGVPGGVEIAHNLLARCWISAHDEDKESSGLAVQKCITDKYGPEQVKQILQGEEEKKPTWTDVRRLAAGDVMVLGP